MAVKKAGIIGTLLVLIALGEDGRNPHGSRFQKHTCLADILLLDVRQ